MKASETKISKLSGFYTELDQPCGGGREEAQQWLVAGASVVVPP